MTPSEKNIVKLGQASEGQAAINLINCSDRLNTMTDIEKNMARNMQYLQKSSTLSANLTHKEILGCFDQYVEHQEIPEEELEENTKWGCEKFDDPYQNNDVRKADRKNSDNFEIFDSNFGSKRSVNDNKKPTANFSNKSRANDNCQNKQGENIQVDTPKNIYSPCLIPHIETMKPNFMLEIEEIRKETNPSCRSIFFYRKKWEIIPNDQALEEMMMGITSSLIF